MGRETFTPQVTKDEIVRIFWKGRRVMTLGCRRGKLLATELADADNEKVQHALQRVTSNFKQGKNDGLSIEELD